MPHESPAAILFDMDGTLMDQSFADDITIRSVTLLPLAVLLYVK
jgi:phosphoserine phosphatase